MISIYNVKNEKIDKNETKFTVELRGLSTDTKPTVFNGKTIENGSSFIEIDTGKIYLFDKESQEWKEV